MVKVNKQFMTLLRDVAGDVRKQITKLPRCRPMYRVISF